MDCSIYRMRQRDVLTICVLALLALGVVMVQSASMTLNGSVVRAPAPDPTAPRQPGPARVASLMATTAADGVELSWDAAAEPEVVAFHVYRAASPAGPFTKLETVRRPGTMYKDRAAPAHEPSVYRVSAVDEAGFEGASATLIAIRPGNWNWTPLASKHLTYVLVALTAFFLIGRIPFTWLVGKPEAPLWRAPAAWAMALVMFLCLVVLIPGIGKDVNGARRWIKLGSVQVQPSELAKWAVVIFLAWWMTRPSVDIRKFFRGLLPTLVPVAAICLLVVIEDFGTAALIGVVALVILLAGRAKWWHVALLVIPAAASAVWFVASEEYRLRRVLAFRDPYASPQGEGYHMIQSLLSYSNGGLLGTGLGNGIQKRGYLPEDTTDFVFSVICEELGLFGALLTMALFAGILYVAWQTIRRVGGGVGGRVDRRVGFSPPRRDVRGGGAGAGADGVRDGGLKPTLQHAPTTHDFGRLLAFGIAAMIGMQAMINMAVATVSVPTKGLSLPLVSAGGTGLIITCAALGLLSSVARTVRRDAGRRASAHEPSAVPITRIAKPAM